MTDIYRLAALRLGLALAATLLSIALRIATAMSEILVGTVAQLVIGAFLGASVLGTDQSWIRFLAGTGAILLTFLAGAELDLQVLRSRWKETTTVGLIAFLAPFLGCAAAAGSHRRRSSWPHVVRALLDRLGGAPSHCVRELRRHRHPRQA